MNDTAHTRTETEQRRAVRAALADAPHLERLAAQPPPDKPTPRVNVALGADVHPETRLRAQQVFALVGLGRTKTYELIRKGEFPEPIRMGARCSRWRAGDVLAWLDAQRAAQGGAQ